MNNVKKELWEKNTIHYKNDAYQTIKWADALILVTEWWEFRTLDFEIIKQQMKGNIIIDGRNLWNREKIEKQWFIYEWILR